MSEIKNGRLGLYGAEHSKCDGTMTLGFKGLICRTHQYYRRQLLWMWLPTPLFGCYRRWRYHGNVPARRFVPGVCRRHGQGPVVQFSAVRLAFIAHRHDCSVSADTVGGQRRRQSFVVDVSLHRKQRRQQGAKSTDCWTTSTDERWSTERLAVWCVGDNELSQRLVRYCSVEDATL